MIGAYLQTIIALAAVVGLILLASFVMKKKQAGRPGGMMNVLGYQSFGPRKGVAALKMGKEVLLLGITSTDVKLLKSFDENEFEVESVAEMNDRLRMLKDMKERVSDHK